jgi:hypothetical protein
MATLEQIEEGIRRAHAAGDVVSIKALGAAYRAMQAEQQTAAPSEPQGYDPQRAVDYYKEHGVPGHGLQAFADQAIDAIPVAGPFIKEGLQSLRGGLSGMFGGPSREEMDSASELAVKGSPGAAMAGQAFGSIAPLAPLGATALGGRLLGLTGNIGSRIGLGAVSQAGLSGADTLARGGDMGDAATAGGIGAFVGGGIPLVGAGVRAAMGPMVRPAVQTVRGLFNRDAEAARRVTGAFANDLRSGPVMSQADEAMARTAGAEVVNADRGGQAVRTLARTAANVSPAADGTLRRLTEERFATQGNRATAFIRRIMGGNVDDLATQDRLTTAARNANRPAYRQAYSAPEARAIWNPEIRQLMQSDIFRQAIDGAESVGTDFAALRGGPAVRNPFTFGADGSIGLRTLPDGSRALPSLQFWDIVQRNLRKTADTARRAGDMETADRAGQLRTALNATLDAAVPAFNAARTGAARFFGAEDALEAGKLFARQPRTIPEARRAHAQFTPEEREIFATGYASELIDTIKASRDRVNVINQVFGSQASRESIELALGPQRAREVEAFVRMEGILDQLRTAVTGNSTTAKQLIAAGVLGGGVSALQGGDLTNIGSSAVLFAAGRRGLQIMGKAVDDRVMQRVAEMLSSQDPALLTRIVQNAQLSAEHLRALEAIQRGLTIAAKGVGLEAPRAVNDITVYGGNPALAN